MRKSSKSPFGLSEWFVSLEDDVPKQRCNSNREKMHKADNVTFPLRFSSSRPVRNAMLGRRYPYEYFSSQAKTGRDDPLWEGPGNSNNNEDEDNHLERHRESQSKKPRDKEHDDVGLPYSAIVVRNAKDLVSIAEDDFLWKYSKKVVPPLAIELTRKEISNIQEYFDEIEGPSRASDLSLSESAADVVKSMRILQENRKMKTKALTTGDARFLVFFHTKESIFNIFGGLRYDINEGEQARLSLDGPNTMEFESYVSDFICDIHVPMTKAPKRILDKLASNSFCRATEYYRSRIWESEDYGDKPFSSEPKNLLGASLVRFEAQFWSVKVHNLDAIFVEKESEAVIHRNASLVPASTPTSIPWRVSWTANAIDVYKFLSSGRNPTVFEGILDSKIDVIEKNIQARGGRGLLSIESTDDYGEYLEKIRFLIAVAELLGMERIKNKYSLYKKEYDADYLGEGETFEARHTDEILSAAIQIYEENADDITDEIGQFITDDDNVGWGPAMDIELVFEFTLPKEIKEILPLILLGDRRKANEWIAE